MIRIVRQPVWRHTRRISTRPTRSLYDIYVGPENVKSQNFNPIPPKSSSYMVQKIRQLVIESDTSGVLDLSYHLITSSPESFTELVSELNPFEIARINSLLVDLENKALINYLKQPHYHSNPSKVAENEEKYKLDAQKLDLVKKIKHYYQFLFTRTNYTPSSLDFENFIRMQQRNLQFTESARLVLMAEVSGVKMSRNLWNLKLEVLGGAAPISWENSNFHHIARPLDASFEKVIPSLTQLIEQFNNSGIRPDLKTHEIIVSCLGRRAKVEDLQLYIERVWGLENGEYIETTDPSYPNLLLVRAVFESFAANGHADLAIEYLNKFFAAYKMYDRQNSPTFWLSLFRAMEQSHDKRMEHSDTPSEVAKESEKMMYLLWKLMKNEHKTQHLRVSVLLHRLGFLVKTENLHKLLMHIPEMLETTDKFANNIDPKVAQMYRNLRERWLSGVLKMAVYYSKFHLIDIVINNFSLDAQMKSALSSRVRLWLGKNIRFRERLKRQKEEDDDDDSLLGLF